MASHPRILPHHQEDHCRGQVRGGVSEIGDRSLVKIVAFHGKHKLSDKWEEEPHVVIDQPNKDNQVYVDRK